MHINIWVSFYNYHLIAEMIESKMIESDTTNDLFGDKYTIWCFHECLLRRLIWCFFFVLNETTLNCIWFILMLPICIVLSLILPGVFHSIVSTTMTIQSILVYKVYIKIILNCIWFIFMTQMNARHLIYKCPNTVWHQTHGLSSGDSSEIPASIASKYKLGYLHTPGHF